MSPDHLLVVADRSMDRNYLPSAAVDRRGHCAKARNDFIGPQKQRYPQLYVATPQVPWKRDHQTVGRFVSLLKGSPY